MTAPKSDSDDKSSATENQRRRLLAALKSGRKTSYELRCMGFYQAPARILELRRSGHEITTTRITVVDDQGYSHPQAALYELLEQS